MKELDEQGFLSISCRDRAGDPMFRGVIGAIDGIAINIVRPRKNIDGVKDPAHYFNRKGFFALNVQAIFDSQRRFTWASVQHQGSCHDSTAFASTYLARKLAKQRTGQNPYFIMGDDAYSAHEYIVMPWQGRGLPWGKDAYNFWQSHLRINVDYAFGILVNRSWGILWRPLSKR